MSFFVCILSWNGWLFSCKSTWKCLRYFTHISKNNRHRINNNWIKAITPSFKDGNRVNDDWIASHSAAHHFAQSCVFPHFVYIVRFLSSSFFYPTSLCLACPNTFRRKFSISLCILFYDCWHIDTKWLCEVFFPSSLVPISVISVRPMLFLFVWFKRIM